ncbi:MAG: hypothetical protein AAGJ40_19280 [Planctomycetota bacterium]
MTGDLLTVVDRLGDESISLEIIGGHAVNVHGYARSTEDIDIDPAAGIERTYPVTIDYIRRRRLMMLGTDYGYVDLFDHVPAMPDARVDDLIADAATLKGHPYASLSWLRRMKSASGRPVDRVDLQSLPLPDRE